MVRHMTTEERFYLHSTVISYTFSVNSFSGHLNKGSQIDIVSRMRAGFTCTNKKLSLFYKSNFHF